LVSQVGAQPLSTFKQRLDKFVESFARPRERRIAYGNLRHEYSEWGEGNDGQTNVALIYETPGGSTTQINVTFDHGTGEFNYLSPEGAQKVTTHDPNQPLQMIVGEVRAIPQRRMQSLQAQIENWCEEGKCQRELFAEMNRLLQSDFLGGSITQRELRLGIKHAIELQRGPTSP
jgi:hypothetical protein